jgi:ABC-2 type transport system permease protein
MRKAFLVARYEYLKMVRKRSFLLGTLSIPLLIVVLMAVAVVVSVRGGSNAPVGYVDHAGILDPAVRRPRGDDDVENNGVEIRAYPDEAATRTALGAQEIQAYYVIPEDYLATGEIQLYYWSDAPGSAVQAAFGNFLRANLVKDLPDAAARRVSRGFDLTMRSADDRREIKEPDFFIVFLPLIGGMFFPFAVTSSAQYMMRAVSDEKENRTMEILVSSLTPAQLIGGKAVGLVCVALTQLLIWVATMVIGLGVAAQFLPPLRVIEVPWDFVLVSVAYFLPSFILTAGMMVAIGSIFTEYREGQQVAGILNMVFMLPYFVIAPFFLNPNGSLPVLLTLFPPTAYISITLRWGMGVVPLWQIALSLLLLVGSALFAVWAAARIFRVGMLSYGQRLGLRTVVAAIRGR